MATARTAGIFGTVTTEAQGWLGRCSDYAASATPRPPRVSGHGGDRQRSATSADGVVGRLKFVWPPGGRGR